MIIFVKEIHLQPADLLLDNFYQQELAKTIVSHHIPSKQMFVINDKEDQKKVKEALSPNKPLTPSHFVMT